MRSVIQSPGQKHLVKMAFDIQVYYKLIRPLSLSDSNHEQYEYLLKWKSKKGGVKSRMFTDRESSIKTKTSQINISDSEEMENIIESEERFVTVIGENYSKNDMLALSSIFSSTIIERVLIDGTKERVGIVSNTYKYTLSEGKYNIEFQLKLYEKPLPK